MRHITSIEKRIYLLFFSFLAPGSITTIAQNPRIDSLNSRLKEMQAAGHTDGSIAISANDTLASNILYELFIEYFYDDPDKAMDKIKKSLEFATKAGFKRGIGNAYNGIGSVLSYKGEYFQAIVYYQRALTIRKEIGDKNGVASALNNIGNLYADQGNYPEAVKNYFSALKIREETGDKNGVAMAYNNIGTINSAQGNYEEALKNHAASLKIKTELGEKKGIANSYNNIGNIYFKKGNNAASLENYFESLSIREEINDKYGMAISYGNIGNIYFTLGNVSKAGSSERARYHKLALKNHQKALKIEEEIGDANGKTLSLCNIGNIFIALNRLKEAFKYLNNALTLSREIGSLDYIKFSYSGFSKLDSARGDFEGAFRNYKMYIVYRDSLLNEENTKKTVQSQMQYDFDKKEALAEADHKKELLIRQAELARQKEIRKLTTAGFTSGITILAVIVFLLFSRFKLKKKIEGQQAIIEERVRISRELHDDVGAQLSTAKMFLSDLKKNFTHEKGNELIDSSLGLLETSIKDLRVVMDDLRQSTLKDKGYIEATEELVKQINQQHGIYFMMSHHGINERLPQETEHHLYRITQEVINNTLKYANAKNVTIDLVKQADRLVLTYEDDGIGFDMSKVKRGYGLANIESRIKSLDGHLEINTAVGKGFMVVIEIPFVSVG